jgi:uncharacterized protein YndB with AHSA1/START domain
MVGDTGSRIRDKKTPSKVAIRIGYPSHHETGRVAQSENRCGAAGGLSPASDVILQEHLGPHLNRMPEIRHRVGIKAPAAEIYDALHQPVRLVGWWPAHATGESDLGCHIELEFPGYPNQLWEITSLEAPNLVALTFVSGAEAWQGSKLRFEIVESLNQVFVTLIHETSPEILDDAFQFFTTKWPLFLVSLKDYLETGKGRPYPNDIRIQHD